MSRIPQYKPGELEQPANFNKKANDFFIEPLSLLNEKSILPSLPHRNTVNDFVFVVNGELDKMVCSDVFTLNAGMFMILPNYKIRTLLHHSKNIDGYYCHFSDDFVSENSGLKKVQEIFQRIEMTNNQTFLLVDDCRERVTFLLAQMLILYKGNDQENLLKLYLNTVLGELTHFVKSLPMPVFSPKENLTQEFRKLITANIHHTHTIKAYADLLHVSPNHLNKSVKTTTGKTASDIISEALIMEAKALLSLPQNNIAEIAFSLGFEDLSYFSRFFKKHTQQSPSDYRKTIGLS